MKGMVSLAPVITFLLVLLHLDSHRLIGHHRIAQVFGLGTLLAICSYFVNGAIMDVAQLDFTTYSRNLAPLVEELLKALVVVWLFRTERVGFQVDAAIMGFAVGAGFSLVENIFYLYHQSEAHYAIWVVRGFGTAIMHGGCTAIFAVLGQIMTERHLKMNPLWYLPGLLAAALFHAVFNYFPVSPILSTVMTLMIIPTLLFLLFEKNEVTIHNFLELDFELHRKLLQQLEGGEASGCETGRFLQDLEKHLQTEAATAMRSYIQLHTELVLSAEGLLLAREQGLDVVVEDTTRHKIIEMHVLERRIGKTGMHTLSPHLKLSKHEFWVIHMFEDELPEMA